MNASCSNMYWITDIIVIIEERNVLDKGKSDLFSSLTPTMNLRTNFISLM